MSSLTSVGAVANYLGVTFTVAQTAEATALLPAADAAIQTYCDRRWLSGAITNEVYLPEGPLLVLRQRPVASIEAITAAWYFAATPVTLTAGTDYLVRDLTRGLVLLTPWRTGRPTDRPYETLAVSYTPVATVPEDVALAATMLVAAWLGASTDGTTADIKRYSVGGELSVERFDQRWPADALSLLAPYRSTLVFA
jgi:hypothetical protein